MPWTQVRASRVTNMKTNKYFSTTGIGLGLLLISAHAHAANTPRHLFMEDEGAPIELTVEAPQTAAVPVPITPIITPPETVTTFPAKDIHTPTQDETVVPDAATSTQDESTETTADSIDNADDDLSADPSENINRKIFAMNEGLDKIAIKPVAKGYKKIVPAGIRRCVSNMFDNLSTPYTAVNNILQGKVKSAGQDMGRVIVNSVLGIGGCFDVATKFGIPKHEEDFGQTLGVWGVPSGRFVMLPALGPSTMRDALAKPVDMLANPIGYITNIRLRNSLTGSKLVDTRANLLEVTDRLDESALDKYTMVRDAWAQRRAAQVRDEDGSYDAINADAPRELTPSLTP